MLTYWRSRDPSSLRARSLQSQNQHHAAIWGQHFSRQRQATNSGPSTFTLSRLTLSLVITWTWAWTSRWAWRSPVAPIVRKPAFRKSSWRSRQANQECFSERHVSLMTLTVISSNEQRVKQPTYAVVQVPRLSSLSEGIVPGWLPGELNFEGCFVACQGQGRGRGRLSRCENS